MPFARRRSATSCVATPSAMALKSHCNSRCRQRARVPRNSISSGPAGSARQVSRAVCDGGLGGAAVGPRAEVRTLQAAMIFPAAGLNSPSLRSHQSIEGAYSGCNAAGHSNQSPLAQPWLAMVKALGCHRLQSCSRCFRCSRMSARMASEGVDASARQANCAALPNTSASARNVDVCGLQATSHKPQAHNQPKRARRRVAAPGGGSRRRIQSNCPPGCSTQRIRCSASAGAISMKRNPHQNWPGTWVVSDHN